MKNILQQTAGRTAAISGWSSRITGLTGVLAGICFCALFYNPGQTFGAIPPDTYSLTLAWNASASSQVTGYNVYYGTTTGTYTSSILLGNVTTATVSDLSFGVTYYFAITASDTDGGESDFSNEISYRQEFPGGQIQSYGMSGGQFMLTATGTAGHTYDLEATQDFTTWTVIGTGTADAGGLLDFADPDAASFPQRFYRTRDTQP